jgi:hypothetical protein
MISCCVRIDTSFLFIAISLMKKSIWLCPKNSAKSFVHEIRYCWRSFLFSFNYKRFHIHYNKLKGLQILTHLKRRGFFIQIFFWVYQRKWKSEVAAQKWQWKNECYVMMKERNCCCRVKAESFLFVCRSFSIVSHRRCWIWWSGNENTLLSCIIYEQAYMLHIFT